MVNETILEIKDLHVLFHTDNTEVQAVRGVSLELKEKETLAIVGESGSGKSVTAQSILKLIDEPAGKIKKGSILYQGKELMTKSDDSMSTIRGKEIGMVFQDPMTSLNPTLKVGRQIAETIIKHEHVKKDVAYDRAVKLLALVGIPHPEKRIKQYPHEFSGGMRQRVMIAIALACQPKILIADEPTTALDVTIQAQIIELLNELQKSLNMSTIIITHDLGVVANIAHKVAVMYGGKIVETGTINEVFYNPKHPYTWGLLSSIPKMDEKGEKLTAIHGAPPNLANPPNGCPFSPRCPFAMKICVETKPEMIRSSDSQQTACWLLHKNAPAIDIPNTARIEG